MAMTLTRLTPFVGAEILSLADARAHLRVTHTDENDLIASLRDAACEYVERLSGVALAPANYLWEGSAFSRLSALPLRPVTAIVSVAYTDANGAEATYSTARLVNGAILPAFGDIWPTSYGYVGVTFTAGNACPPDLLAAIKLMLGHLYDNRSATSDREIKEAPLAVDALIQTHRMVMV